MTLHTRSDSVAVLEPVKIDVEALPEVLLTKVIRDHTNDASTFAIGDGIEYLVDISGFTNIHFNRMRVTQRVHLRVTCY